MVELEAKQADMRLRNGAVDPVPQAQEPSVHLVARNPVEMESAKSNLVLWLQQKIRQCAGYTQKEISFLIAWHLDLRTL